MAISNDTRVAIVTTQPCQLHQHLEHATLTVVVNPKAAMGVRDWPAPPRPPSHYGYGGGSSSYQHQHEETRAVKDLVVGWGLQWWTIGMLISDCLVGQISKARSDLEGSKNQVFRSADEKSLAEKKKLSEYTFIATIQVLLGSEKGSEQGPTISSSSRRVAFNTVPQIKYIDERRVLYPPTLKGMQMKRDAFWSKREVNDNQAKWEGHLESYELERSRYGTPCKCYGCLMDGEETNF